MIIEVKLKGLKMKKRRFTLIISIIFVFFMAGMTFMAETIYHKQLPQVEVKALSYTEFKIEYVMKDGVTTTTDTVAKLGVPKEVYQQEKVLAIYQDEVNGRTSTYVREVELELGDENETHYEVLSTNTYFGMVDTALKLVVKSSEELTDGDEVYILDIDK